MLETQLLRMLEEIASKNETAAGVPSAYAASCRNA
jgi:hypothetical protein